MTSATKPAASLNKFEKFKAEKDGLAVKTQLDHFAQLGWEAMDETDREHRLKWLGVFFRPVTPGKFMVRMRLPNGNLTSTQMRVLAEVVQRYGEDRNIEFPRQVGKLWVSLAVVGDHILNLLHQLPRINQLSRVNPSNGRTCDIADIIHPRLHTGQTYLLKPIENIWDIFDSDTSQLYILSGRDVCIAVFAIALYHFCEYPHLRTCKNTVRDTHP